MNKSFAYARYNQRTKFTLQRELTFPDFTLRYTGATKVASTIYPNGFVFQVFLVKGRDTRAPKAQQIRWSAGTGDIAPLPFSVNGKTFSLELRISDTLGKLAPDELVILSSNIR